MRERINRLARGIVEGESPVLQIEPQSVKDSVPAGAVTKKELYISDEQEDLSRFDLFFQYESETLRQCVRRKPEQDFI